MFSVTRDRMATAVWESFEILVANPKGMEVGEVVREIKDRRDKSSPNLWNSHQNWTDLKFGMIAPRNAGWLVEEDGRWCVTAQGRSAFSKYADCISFFYAAGKQSWRGWVATRLPAPLALVAQFRYQLQIEYRLIRRVGVRQLLKELFGRVTRWQQVLPIQMPRLLVIDGFSASSLADLEGHFRQRGAAYSSGGHTVYLSPDAWARTAFSAIQAQYPEGAGLKIVKNPGGVAEAHYVNSGQQGNSSLHKMITHSHGHLALVGNLFYSHGIGPRPIDLVELQTGNTRWTANVVQHVDGRIPTRQETEAGLQSIQDLEAKRVLVVSMPNGYSDEDFRVPDCNGNAITDDTGWKYVDHQNFLLRDYQEYLDGVARECAGESHFGDRSVLRGQQYLYQSVPGVSLPGKRNPVDRMQMISRMLELTRADVKDRLVLDFGCNVGMMMAQYLARGAMWCHGWDTEAVVPKTERLMRAIGCTRFSLTGGNVMQNQHPENDVPRFLAPSLNGCVVSYLAVHNWIGWLDVLGRIPWSFLIFEGHEQDSETHNKDSFNRLAKIVKFDIASYEVAQDGDSDPRAVAILVRKA